MRWIAFYSGTGDEIKSLSKQPDEVYTDNPTAEFGQFVSGNYYKYIQPGDIVTLHGWMNIVPASICKQYAIYNGHPGLITEYPELKGKDPQIRSEKYSIIGSVIHRVTPEVDSGPILYVTKATNDNSDIFKQLKRTSKITWEKFIADYIVDSTEDNGGPTGYYDLDPRWKGAGDIIEAREMTFNQGNMFKVAFCFNIGRHSATNYERELNKIIYFAQRELERIRDGD